jgi:hypothetical protein
MSTGQILIGDCCVVTKPAQYFVIAVPGRASVWCADRKTVELWLKTNWHNRPVEWKI